MIITVLITVGLIFYARFSKSEFKSKWAILICLLLTMTSLSLFLLIWYSKLIYLLYLGLSVTITCIYIIISVQIIIGRK